MAEKGYVLTEQDKAILTEFLRREKSRRIPQRYRDNTIDNEEMLAPEVYVIKTPVEGIPALQEGYYQNAPGTATGTFDDPGTGTGTDYYITTFIDTNDRPGYADCYVYQIIEGEPDYGTGTSAGVPELIPIDQFFKRVYNLELTPYPGNKWVAVKRDKYGSWILPPAPSFSGAFIVPVGNPGPIGVGADRFYPNLGITLIPDNEFTFLDKLNFVEYDTDGYWTYSDPGRLTIPTNGIYQFGCQAHIDNPAIGAVGVGSRNIYIFKNRPLDADVTIRDEGVPLVYDATAAQPEDAIPGGAAFPNYISLASTRYLLRGDYLNVVAYQDSGVTVSGATVNFWIQRVYTGTPYAGAVSPKNILNREFEE